MGIKNFKIGETFTGPLLIKNAKKGKTTNGKNFIGLTLSDSTGEVSANIWESNPELESTILPGSILMVSGPITEFKGKKQINMKSFRLSTPEDNVNVADFLQMAPVDANKMLQEIADEIKNFKNENIKVITMTLLKNNADKFKTHTAAKHVHHSYMGGLAYHTYSMLKIGKAICGIYPILNKDLLLAGIIIHDVGKIHEYTSYPNVETTLDGKLRGHLTMVSEEIAFIAASLNLQSSQEKLLLQHMVLSHHGSLALGWGSAVTPQIIEANMLWRIDTIDAEMDMYKSAISETEIHNFTQRIWGMDNREFYNHGLEN